MPVTASLVPVFPGCPTFGFSAEPDILVKHVIREGGYETSDRKWDAPLRRYEGAPLGPRPQADIESLMHFWLAIGGTAGRFRFKDWADFKSCTLDNTPRATDQPLQQVPGSPGGYQLTKQYSYFGFVHERRITRPKGDTILVANEVGAVQSASSYYVEEDTGLIVPTVGFTGTPTTWGGEFYVYCRFDGKFRAELVNHKIQDLQISVLEVRERAL